jgi:uncharacterized protein YjiS (DUF1127 family)
MRMEHKMASTHITYSDTPGSSGLALAIGHKLVAFAGAVSAYGIWHDVGGLERRSRKHVEAAAEPRSLSAWFGGVATQFVRAIAKEVRIRRDTRQLMGMSDEMLKDIGLTRVEISGTVRYGRD